MLNLGTPKASCESDIDYLTHLSRVYTLSVTTLTNCDTYDHVAGVRAVMTGRPQVVISSQAVKQSAA